jgi:hypothetical protein
MRKLLSLLFICQALIFIQCGDELTLSDSSNIPENITTEKNAEILHDLQLNKGGGNRAECCNNNFPAWDHGNPGGYRSSSLYWCSLEEPEEFMTKEDCGKIWSEYAHVEGEDLNYQACGGYIPDSPATPAWIDGSIVGDNPHLEWGFIYSHKYIVQRKIGNNSWSTIDTVDNCIVDENNCQDSFYTDTSIDLDTISVNYYYRVKAIIYTSTSEASETVTFTAPLSVNISGPTSLTTIQLGTFTADVMGGLPDYSYEWWKYQDCDLRGTGGLRAPPCGSWKKLAETSNTLVTGGNVPGFNLKVNVTDQENETDVDFHYVRVRIP